MTIWIKEATAGTYPIGPMTDGSGIRLGSLNILRGQIQLSKTGGAFATISGVATAYADKNGNYFVGFDTTDTNTKGPLQLDINNTSALPFWKDFMVVGSNAWNAMFGGSLMQVGTAANAQYVGTVDRVLSVGSLDAGIVGSVLHAASVGTSLHAQTVGTVLHAQIVGTVTYAGKVGSVGHVASMSNPIVGGGSIGHVASMANPIVAGGTIDRVLSVGSLDAGIVGTVLHSTTVGGGFVGSAGMVGSVAYVGKVGSVGHVASMSNPVVSDGVIGSVAFISDGLIGSVGHVASGYTMTVGTVARVLSVGSIDAGIIGTVGYVASMPAISIGTVEWVMDGVLGSVGFVSDGLIGSVGHVSSGYSMTVGTVSRVLSVGSIDAGIIGTVGYVASLPAIVNLLTEIHAGVNKVKDTVCLKIYSDAARTNLLDILYVEGYVESTKWQYIFGFVNDNTPFSGLDFDGYVQNVAIDNVAEDFTTYTEVDTNGKLTVTATKALAADADRDEDVYLYKDKGANYFDNLDIDFELYIASTSLDDSTAGMAITNTVSSYRGFATTDIAVKLYKVSASIYRLILTRGLDVDSDNYICAANTIYYCTLSRGAGVIQTADAIRAKTEQITFTETNRVDASVGTVSRVLSVGSLDAGIVGTIGYVASLPVIGTVSRVLSVGSLDAGIVGTVSHASSVGTALHAQTTGTGLFIRGGVIGSLGFVSDGIIGTTTYNRETATLNWVKDGLIGSIKHAVSVGSVPIVGTVVFSEYVGTVSHAKTVASLAFVSDGIIGSVGHVASQTPLSIGTVEWVMDGKIGSVGFVSDGKIGSVGWVKDGIIGTLTYGREVATVGFVKAGNIDNVTRVQSVGSLDAGAVGTILHAVTVGTATFVRGGIVGSAGFVSNGMIGTVGRVLSVGSLTAGIIGTISHCISIATLSGLTAGVLNDIADAVLKRDIDNVEASAAVHSLCSAVLKAVSRVKDNAGTLETYRTDGTTKHMEQAITTDSGNEPIDELGGAT